MLDNILKIGSEMKYSSGSGAKSFALGVDNLRRNSAGSFMLLTVNGDRFAV